MAVSSETGKPVIRSADRLLDETRLVYQSRDEALQWAIDNMATKGDIAGVREDIDGIKSDVASLREDIAALAESVKEGFNTLGVNIANGDHRIRPVR